MHIEASDSKARPAIPSGLAYGAAYDQLRYRRVARDVSEDLEGPVIGESHWRLYVNAHEWLTIVCTPRDLHYLALGFLTSEGVIRTLDDVVALRVYEREDRSYCYFPAFGVNGAMTIRACAESVGAITVRLAKAVTLPARRILTSGCGGGVTFDDLTKGCPRVDSALRVAAENILRLMHELQQRAALYRACRGVHTAALADIRQLRVLAEDIGRHNTLDKIRGECLMRDLPTNGGILLCTGRVSSEMLTKAAKMEIPIVASLTSPTSLSLQLAKHCGITVIGYVRGGEMRVYTSPERLV